VDRNGTTFNKTHDHMGRLRREEATQNGVVQGFRAYTFMATGAVWTRTIEDAGRTHTMTYEYDAQGRLTLVSQGTGRIQHRFDYNTANNVTRSRTYIDEQRYIDSTYTFDLAQRVRRSYSNGVRLVEYTYNANGSITRETRGNNLITDHTRNLAGLATSVVNRRGNTTLSRFDYTHYLDGNVRTVNEVDTSTNINRTKTYTYDLARRLIREETTSLGESSEGITRHAEWVGTGIGQVWFSPRIDIESGQRMRLTENNEVMFDEVVTFGTHGTTFEPDSIRGIMEVTISNNQVRSIHDPFWG